MIHSNKELNPISGPKIAVFGTTGISEIFIRILNRLGCLGAIINSEIKRSEGNLDEFRGMYNVPIYNSLEECSLTDKKIVGLVIPTSTSTLENILFCIEKNIRNFLLLPNNSLEIDELDKIKDLSIKNEIKINVGFVENFNPVIKKMWELIEKDAIGEIRSILIERQSAVPTTSIKELGDIFTDIGLHDFNLSMKFLEGEIEINAHSSKETEIFNTATICLRSNDKLITLNLSREYAGRKRNIEIEGTKATMHINLIAQTIDINYLGIAIGETQSITVGIDEGTLIKTYGEPLQEEIWDFLDNIVNENRKPLIDISEVIKTLNLAKAAKKSASTHKKIKLSQNRNN